MPEAVFDIEGHRGCRGLMPENTLPAFQKALELGVNTLEMDLVISSDHKVVVSHEPFFRAGIALTPDGDTIPPGSEDMYNMYKMTYDEIKSYIVGTLPDPLHPNRENVRTFKPLFGNVVRKALDYARTNQTELPFFNIEIKRNPQLDSIFHPPVKQYVNLVLNAVKGMAIEDKVILQSFDLETLRLVKIQAPDIAISLLIENQNPAKLNIEALGFKPDIYSCYFKLLDASEVAYCHQLGIKVIPWTVNLQEDIQSMIDIGVDGIISDYPDRVIATVR